MVEAPSIGSRVALSIAVALMIVRSGAEAAGAAPAAPAHAAGQASAPALVDAPRSGLSITSAEYHRLYGPGTVVIDRLGYNYVQRLESIDYAMSQRFRAPASGVIEAIRIYTPVGAPEGGYAGGNGGTLKISVYPDDGQFMHAPNRSVKPLTTVSYRPGMTHGTYAEARSMFPLISFPPGAPLVAGKLYHLVYEQVDPQPSVNFANVNSTATNPATGKPMRWTSTTDWGVMYGKRPVGRSGDYAWADASNTPYGGLLFAPILEIRLTSGRTFGSSVMESGNVEPRIWIIDAKKPVRERFVASEPRTITGLSLQTASVAGGSLQWEIKQGETSLAKGVITEPAGTFKTITSLTYQQGVYHWFDAPLPAPVDFVQGETYDVVFTPIGSSRWRFAGQSNGGQWGFDYPAAFTESQAQHLVNGVWLNANIWNLSRSTSDKTNWRLVLHGKPSK
ncbi:MAG: hypothetical protein QM766_12725 [Burkholderiaceae bacterium]